MMNCEEMGQKGVLQQLFARGTPGLAGHLIGGFMFFSCSTNYGLFIILIDSCLLWAPGQPLVRRCHLVIQRGWDIPNGMSSQPRLITGGYSIATSSEFFGSVGDPIVMYCTGNDLDVTGKPMASM